MNDTERNLRRRLAREIQARQQAETLLEQKSEELYDSLFQLRSALEAMAEGLLLTDEQHQVVLSNGQLRDLYPSIADQFARSSSLIHSFPAMLEHPAYQEFLRDRLQSTSFEIESEDGRIIAVNVRRTQNGQFASTHQEITQQKTDERERRQLLINLMRAQRLESIGRMSGMIAHDFNNIIAAIKGYVGFLEEDVQHTPAVDESIDALTAATEKAEKLIQNILEFDSRQQFSRQAVSLIPVIEECLDLTEPRFRNRITLHTALPEEPIWLESNETRLNQLFMNLLSNADRAMQGKDHDLHVTVKTHSSLDLSSHVSDCWHQPMSESLTTCSGVTVFDGPCVCVSICDSGRGMTESVLSNMFEAYFTTRQSGRIGGLGLASVADIIADNAGGLRVITAPEKGTIVQLVFPTTTAAAPHSVPAADATNTAPLESMSVMVIDDDVSVGAVITEMLKREGVNADYFNNAEGAQYHLMQDHRRWQLVICDQIMPDLKGSELLQSLRNADIDIPFVICSGHLDSVGSETALKLADGFLAKPVERSALIECVEKLIYPTVSS